MRSAKKQFGKQQPKPAELGTENRRTRDVKPRTRNTQQETSDPRGPNSASSINNFCLSFLIHGKGRQTQSKETQENREDSREKKARASSQCEDPSQNAPDKEISPEKGIEREEKTYRDKNQAENLPTRAGNKTNPAHLTCSASDSEATISSNQTIIIAADTDHETNACPWQTRAD